ncbi:hypothetical protein [Cystobacter ferrugineus]|nr:hypothetical protein [Cystobacter ferrugineus]
MTWMLQAAVVLAVPLSLGGAVWTGVRLIRAARAARGAAASTAVGLYTRATDLDGDAELGLGGFKGWLADLIDGASDSDASSGFDASCGEDGDP